MGSSFVSILTTRSKTNVMPRDRFANKEFQGKGNCQIQHNLNDKKDYAGNRERFPVRRRSRAAAQQLAETEHPCPADAESGTGYFGAAE